MVAKYELGSNKSTSTNAKLNYIWFKAIQDFSDGISVTGLALNTDESALAAVGSYQSSSQYLQFSILETESGMLRYPV
jgi:hypothetical protein